MLIHLIILLVQLLSHSPGITLQQCLQHFLRTLIVLLCPDTSQIQQFGSDIEHPRGPVSLICTILSLNCIFNPQHEYWFWSKHSWFLKIEIIMKHEILYTRKVINESTFSHDLHNKDYLKGHCMYYSHIRHYSHSFFMGKVVRGVRECMCGWWKLLFLSFFLSFSFSFFSCFWFLTN